MPDTWKNNPCGCRWCHVCGMFGLAPMPLVKPKPEPKEQPTTVIVKNVPSLFDAIEETRA
jgi:hypothetical protein